MEASVEEEVWKVFMDLYNTISVGYWSIISETSQTCSRIVLIIPLYIILLKDATTNHEVACIEFPTTTKPEPKCELEYETGCKPTSTSESRANHRKFFGET